MKSENPTNGSSFLKWPEELAGEGAEYVRWAQAGSNICLDFHGDPLKAQLVVLSDGNHHMALQESLALFRRQNDGLDEIFYATTPPAPIISILKQGGLLLGNLYLSVSPHVFISPPDILDKLVADGNLNGHEPLVQNQGNVLLVKKGNPKCIFTVGDILRDEVRLFLSNPDTEKASFTAYYQTLNALAAEQEPGLDFFDHKASQNQVVYGELIHHREAPQAVAEGAADVAVVFYHLALRYTRIFPETFELVPLGGSVDEPEPLPGNPISLTHMGLVGYGGAWGEAFISFMKSDDAMQIYQKHGLKPLSG